MVFVLRKNLTIAFCCQLADDLTGNVNGNMVGQSFLDCFIDKNEVEAAKSAFQRVLKREHPACNFDQAVLDRNGKPQTMSWTTVFLDAYDGEPALLAIGRDVSIQQIATEAIQDREARLQAILDVAVDGIITTDERGIIVTVNPAAEKIFGYKSNELIGRNISLLMTAPHRDDHDLYIAEYIKTGRRRVIGIGREVDGLRKDGSIFPLDLAVSEAIIGNRRLFTGILRDITERRRNQQQHLQAERLAAIGQMVAGLAHESRNAFQRSQACLELLESEVHDRPEAGELIQKIQRAQNHIYHLYEEVRNFAAPINLDRQFCDLARIWRRVWADLELTRSEKHVEIKELCSAIGLTCQADSHSLEQVFRNIFQNAIEACKEPGEILIECADATLDHRPAVCVVIRDNGPGLEPEAQERIFEPFFTTKTKGTGLGMAIARRIVQAHHGTIEAPGGAQHGAAIVLTLPREEA